MERKFAWGPRGQAQGVIKLRSDKHYRPRYTLTGHYFGVGSRGLSPMKLRGLGI